MKDWHSHLSQYDAEKAAHYRSQGWWRDRLLAEHLAEAAAQRPDHPAVIDRSGVTTYRELGQAADAVAAGLALRGVEPGDVVSSQLPNWWEALAVASACSRIGAVYNGISPIFRARDVRTMARLAQPRVFIAPAEFRGFDHAALALDIAAQTPSITSVILIGDHLREGAESWTDLTERSDVLLPPRPHPDQVAEIAFTSGTTGEPKGILHTHNTALAPVTASVERFGLNADDVFHMASTIGHQTGFLFGVEMPIVVGGTVVLQEAWDAEEFVRLVAAHKITMTNGAIPFLSDTLSAANFAEHDLSSLRLFGCFGAGLPSPLATEAATMLPDAQLFGGWGMTEIGLAVTNLPGDRLEDICTSDGVAMPGAEVIVVDELSWQELPPDEEGQFLTRGALRHLGFIQTELMAQCLRPDDWYITGDRGYKRPDGQLVMTTRAKDIIVRGGENIPVSEVESLLLAHPAIASVAVVAVPDKRLGERACACVITHSGHGFDLAMLQDWCREQELTPQFWPESLRVMDTFPLTPSGKIKKFTLRAELAVESAEL